MHGRVAISRRRRAEEKGIGYESLLKVIVSRLPLPCEGDKRPLLYMYEDCGGNDTFPKVINFLIFRAATGQVQAMEKQRILSEASQAIVNKIAAIEISGKFRNQMRAAYALELKQQITAKLITFTDIEDAAKFLRDARRYSQAARGFDFMRSVAKSSGDRLIEAKAYSQLIKTYSLAKQDEKALKTSEEFYRKFERDPQSGIVAFNQLRTTKIAINRHQQLRAAKIRKHGSPEV